MHKTVSVQRFDSRSANRYKEIKFDPPKVILGRLRGLEKEIASDLPELKGVLK